MLPKDWMKTPQGKVMWEKLFGRLEDDVTTKDVLTTKKETVLYQELLPVSHISLTKHPTTQTCVVSSPPLEELVQTISQQQITVRDNKKDYVPHNRFLQLADIAHYFKHKGVVGEEALVISAYLALSNNISFGVEGYSGSGKTFLVDKLIELLPKDDVYRAELSSKMALFYDQERVNNSRIIYIPELQKALNEKTSPVAEIIKNLTEGKDARRLVTGKDLQSSEEFIINKDKTIVYTLALENYFKKDNESSRRFMRLMTDSSPEHIHSIHQYKANARMQLTLSQEKEYLSAHLSAHLALLRNLRVQVIDPFAEYLQAIIPKTQKSVGYVDHYYNLVDACTRFHLQERDYFSFDGQDYVLATIQDHYYTHQLYHTEFLKTLDDLAKTEEKNAKMPLPDWKTCFLEGKSRLYQDNAFSSIFKEDPSLLKSWEERQIQNNTLQAKDYKTGELFIMVE